MDNAEYYQKLKSMSVKDISSILKLGELSSSQILSLVTRKIISSPSEWQVREEEIYAQESSHSDNPAIALFRMMEEQVYPDNNADPLELIYSLDAINKTEVRKGFRSSTDSALWYAHMIGSLTGAVIAKATKIERKGHRGQG